MSSIITETVTKELVHQIPQISATSLQYQLQVIAAVLAKIAKQLHPEKKSAGLLWYEFGSFLRHAFLH